VALVASGGAVAAANTNRPGQPASAHAKKLAAIDTSTESSYTPIAQCRVVDTRAAGGLLKAGQARNWHVWGTAGFPAQGGTSGGCGVPRSATAVTAVVQSISATGAGALRLWPFGSPEPPRNFLDFTKLYNVSSNATFQINTAGADDISVRAETQSTQVVIDVTGYFVKPMSAHVASDGSLIGGSRATAIQPHAVAGLYAIQFDRDITACAYSVTGAEGPHDFFTAMSTSAGSHQVTVQVRGPDGNLIDAEFYLTVTC